MALVIVAMFATGCCVAKAQVWRQSTGARPVPVDLLFGNDELLVARLNQAGVFSGALVISRNAGTTWSIRGAGVYVPGSFAHLNPGTVINGRLLISVWYDWFGAVRGGVYASDDTGRTWYPYALKDIAVLSVRPFGIRGLIALTKDRWDFRRWFVSTDAGQNWLQFGELPDGSHISGNSSIVAVIDDTTILALDYERLYISRDAAVTWAAIDGVAFFVKMGVAFDGAVFGVDQNLSWSRDTGRTWSYDTIPNAFRENTVDGLLVTQSGAVFLSSRYSGLWRRSPSGGWRRVGPFQRIEGVVALSDRLVVATERGVYVSIDDGQTFLPQHNGMPLVTGTSFVKLPSGVLLVAPLEPGGSSEDGGLSWTGSTLDSMRFPGRDVPHQVVSLSDGTVIGATHESGVMVLEPDSMAWRSTGLSGLPGGGCDCDVERLSSSLGESLLAYTPNAMYRISRIGVVPQQTKFWFSEVVRAGSSLVAAVPTQGPFSGAGWAEPGLYWSTDDGETWLRKSGPSSYMAVGSFRDGSVIAATTDAVEQWSAAGEMITRLPIAGAQETNVERLITIEPSTVLLARSDLANSVPSSYAGVWRSDAFGASWRAANIGLDAPHAIYSVAQFDNRRLLASTAHGIYTAELASLSIPTVVQGSDVKVAVNNEAELLRVEFADGVKAPVSCELVDLRGQVVLSQTSLLLEERIVLTTSGLPASGYLLRVFQDGRVVFSSMVYVGR